jgi:CheY-like chemotaxis protein
MPKCILIVDDDRVASELAKRTIQTKGYEVMTAQDGQEALEGLKAKVPDLILLDVQMPKMDGYTFIMKKNSDPAFASIPVIVLSSMGKTEPMFKRHGVKAYLIKPLNTQELLDKIQAIVPS